MTRKVCNKQTYPTLREAREAILGMTRRYQRIVYKKAYRCATCKGWHITSTPPPRGRRIKR